MNKVQREIIKITSGIMASSAAINMILDKQEAKAHLEYDILTKVYKAHGKRFKQFKVEMMIDQDRITKQYALIATILDKDNVILDVMPMPFPDFIAMQVPRIAPSFIAA